VQRESAAKEVCPSSIRFLSLRLLASLLLCASTTLAQNVTTQHNDISRTGANTNETILTPGNVNATNFGKLFYYTVDGYVYAQPLYMANVPIASGRHNVVFVATQHDSVYAFDADSNLGANAQPLWKITLLDSAHGAGSNATPEPSSDFGYTDIVPEVGITSTPVIDPSTSTIYVVGKTKESGKYFYRLHALDITTGLEQFGGPITVSASLTGTGSGSSSGMLTFDPTYQLQRPGLLLLNGIVYLAFGATYDVTPAWHGWIFGYKNNATTKQLEQSGVWCGSRNGNGSSLWLSGAGLAADVPANQPFGRLFTGTGNGSFNATVPYQDTMNYGISVIRLGLANGGPTMNSNGVQVGDMFAPFDQANLDNNDQDQASGGTLILPDVVINGKTSHLMVHAGKSGRVYLLDRDNLGGFNPNNTSDPQQKAAVGGSIYGAPAYWNGHVYFWPAATNGHLKAFSFSIASGVFSSNPTSTSAESTFFPGAVPAVSANGTTNGIVWSIRTDAYASQGPAILYAHDASSAPTLNLLYSSAQNAARDTAGAAVKFATPTITNGKVYVGTENELSVYGLLNGATQAPAPVFSPSGQEFHPSIQITLTDSSPSAQIFYTTDGSTPSTASTLYTQPFNISSTSTVRAIAAGTGFVASTVSSETYTLVNQVPTPMYSPVPGDYTTAQSVTITTTWPGTQTIYYTTDGSTPTTSSKVYSGPVSITTTSTLKAMATASTLTNSSVASGLYTIAPNAPNSINFSGGFSSSGITLVGRTRLSGTRLRLTDGGQTEASTAWYNTQVNVQSFSTDFMFQQTPGTIPRADGMTFAIQRVGTSAIGPYGGGLAYGPSQVGGTPGIPNSVAVKFALFNNGKCNNCTGLYTNGAAPITPEVVLGGGINLQSGDIFAVHISYDGTTLTMTITDTVNNSQTFTTSWPIDIPTTIGGNTAYVGFTAGTGHYTLVQDILNWTYVSNGSAPPTAATPVISPTTGTYTSTQTVTITDSTSNPSIYYTLDGSQPSPSSSTRYTNPFTVSSTTTVKAIATASGFTQSSTATSVITINSEPPAATPLISPATGTFTSPQTVTITDSTSNPSIYYTLDGSQPSPSSSTLYTNPFTVSSTTTVKAIATASGFTQSSTATSVITINSQPSAATPVISPATGTFTSPQTVTITDSTSNPSIFYTLDGSQPSPSSSTLYSNPFTVSSTTTVKAIATASGFTQSNTATAAITIQSSGSPTINFASGFTATGLKFNGRTTLNGNRLQLTDGGQAEASSAWFTTPVNVQSFTNDFTFQFINPDADGMTFTIQNAGTTALGPNGGGLGYGATLPGGTPGIPTSIAVKFDLFQNVHEGTNSTGLYTDGASPTSPSVTIGNGVNLHSGDVLQVHMTYDGTTLTMTITDTVTNAAFTTSFPINIPATVGANTALVGFTGSTGLKTVTQIISWTYGP
jgi:Legume lectin domain/Fn3 associated/Chitobiase/beta-hexosaminidase C-terminal domain